MFGDSAQVRIYARQEMLENLAFASKLAPLFQAWLEEETGIPYLLPKMGKYLTSRPTSHVIIMRLSMKKLTKLKIAADIKVNIDLR